MGKSSGRRSPVRFRLEIQTQTDGTESSVCPESRLSRDKDGRPMNCVPGNPYPWSRRPTSYLPWNWPDRNIFHTTCLTDPLPNRNRIESRTSARGQTLADASQREGGVCRPQVAPGKHTDRDMPTARHNNIADRPRMTACTFHGPRRSTRAHAVSAARSNKPTSKSYRPSQSEQFFQRQRSSSSSASSSNSAGRADPPGRWD